MAGKPQPAGPGPNGPRGQPGQDRPKRDLRDRPAEYTQFDVLDGPCARFFHRFYARRIVTVEQPNPYPPVVGHVYRLCRMLDVADGWELFVLGSFPLWFLLVLNWRALHIPGAVNGLLISCLGLYIGYWFVLMVFLDRRLDWSDLQHVKYVRYGRQQDRSDRLHRRTEAAKIKQRLQEQAAEARKRGAAKAQAATEAPPPGAPPSGSAPPPPALDEMLQN